ncbi:MAG: amidase [Candidatus Rokubacteria bacterium]|nr:amidase [Candidatus Rokubacteria bacterium]
MTEWTACELAAAIRARRISSAEATRGYLDRIVRLDRTLRAFITVDGERALAHAKALDAELAAGRSRGPLHGVPLAYKDLCAIPGLPSSCGTRTGAYFVSEHACTGAARLAAAGAVTLGTLNMSELAMGPFGDNAHHGDAQNPWRPGHVSGGSSSGSGVAVAAGLAAGALGTDTGGSIRLPAACCGIVGLKPTYGRVSRAGVMPLSWTMDHLGPMARTVRDVALMLGVIAGHDPLDATSSMRPVADYEASLTGSIAGLRVGVPSNYYFDGLHADVERAAREALTTLQALGARLVDLDLPDPRLLSQGCSNPIVRSEAAAAHARLFRERPEEVQPAVLARGVVGFNVSAVEYLQALRLRARLTREFIAAVFPHVDVLVTPVIPEPAPALADVKAGGVEAIVERMGAFSRLTRPINALGLPALAVPCGFSADGRPLAVQIVGRPFAEATVLRVGDAYQRVTDWHTRRPPID